MERIKPGFQIFQQRRHTQNYPHAFVFAASSSISDLKSSLAILSKQGQVDVVQFFETDPCPASNTAPEEAEHPSREDLEDEWKDHSDAGRTEKVVVEQSWATSGRIGKSTAASSDPDPVEIKSGATPPTLSYPAHDKESAVTGHTGHGFWGRSSLLVKLRYRMWPTVVEFFFSRPFEGSSEEHFRNVR
ncbi:hypothetical protein PQX77_016325 [Marasmius sp. AFHP31]|nr:hypothetical protein PQX77_016325 [Marasmius sp. AFHP31]